MLRTLIPAPGASLTPFAPAYAYGYGGKHPFPWRGKGDRPGDRLYFGKPAGVDLPSGVLVCLASVGLLK